MRKIVKTSKKQRSWLDYSRPWEILANNLLQLEQHGRALHRVPLVSARDEYPSLVSEYGNRLRLARLDADFQEALYKLRSNVPALRYYQPYSGR